MPIVISTQANKPQLDMHKHTEVDTHLDRAALEIAPLRKRRFGGLRGPVTIPEDFDVMPDDLILEFEKSIFCFDSRPISVLV